MRAATRTASAAGEPHVVSVDYPTASGRAGAPPRYRRALALDTLTVLGVAVAVAAVLVLAWFARPVIVWLLAGGFLAFSLDPLVQWLGARLRLPRGMRIAVAFVIVLVALALTAFVFVPPIVAGAQELGEAVPQYIQRLKDSSLNQELGTTAALDGLQSAIQAIPSLFGIAGEVLSFAVPLVGGVFAGVMILFLTVYFLLYGRDIRRGVARRLAPSRAETFLVATKQIYESTKGYWYGKFLIAVIAGGVAYAAMRIVGVPYAAPLAFFVAITDLVPNVGATIGMIPVVIVAAFESWWQAIVIAAILIVYQQIENGVLTPRIFARATDLHPFTTLVAVLLGGTLFGVIGALLAVPIAASVKIVWGHVRGGTPVAEAVPEPTPRL